MSMTTKDYKIYRHLLDEQSISKSKISKGVFNSVSFNGLLNARILITEKVGRGQHIKVQNKESFAKFFSNAFPESFDPNDEVSRANNIRTLRNSKGRAKKSSNICLFRGDTYSTVNGIEVDIRHVCQQFSLFSTQLQSLDCRNLCFVENLETFLYLTHQFGEDVLYLHTYGRVSESVLQGIRADNVWVFVDYDYNGLDEYLRIKNHLSNAQLFKPENYQALFDKYSVSYEKNKKITMSEKVKNSTEQVVVDIRNQVAMSNRFLEQEVVFYD